MTHFGSFAASRQNYYSMNAQEVSSAIWIFMISMALDSQLLLMTQRLYSVGNFVGLWSIIIYSWWSAYVGLMVPQDNVIILGILLIEKLCAGSARHRLWIHFWQARYASVEAMSVSGFVKYRTYPFIHVLEVCTHDNHRSPSFNQTEARCSYNGTVRI